MGWCSTPGPPTPLYMFVYSWNVSKDGVGPITQVFTNSSGESVGGGGGGGGEY